MTPKKKNPVKTISPETGHKNVADFDYDNSAIFGDGDGINHDLYSYDALRPILRNWVRSDEVADPAVDIVGAATATIRIAAELRMKKTNRPKTGQSKTERDRRGRPTGTTRPPSTPATIRRAERKGRPRGRVPEIEAGVNCNVRLPAEIVAALDLWAAKADGATRSAAIRYCVMTFFAEKKP